MVLFAGDRLPGIEWLLVEMRFPMPDISGSDRKSVIHRDQQLRASPPIFRNKVLDSFSRVHPVVPLILYMPLIVYLIVTASSLAPWTTVAMVFSGYVVWTLLEYWGHRLIFHFEPENGFGAKLHWVIHGIHHEHPSDRLRLVMPPAMSVPILFAAYLIFRIGLNGPALNAVMAGFCSGYLAYDMVHYYLHHFKPKTRLGRALRARHMRHHFHDDQTGFGVSAPWWDTVFGTSASKG